MSIVKVLDAETAVLEAQREKQSLAWRARLHLRRVSEIARELAVKTWELMPKKPEGEELPAVDVGNDIQLEPDDDADTARTPTPAPFPIPTRRTSQWEVRTQVVDMTPRRKGKRRSSSVPISDLVLDDPKKR